jgi:Ras GTPase-activating-like protein IQGAP2/3
MQFSIIEEIARAETLADVIHGHPVYINIALHYIRPKQTVHVRETLQPLIRDVVNTEDLDLEVDPKQVTVSRFSRFLGTDVDTTRYTALG